MVNGSYQLRTPVLVSLLAAGAVVGFLAACSNPGPAPSAAVVRPERRDNVVIFLIDTLRRDRLGCYGHSRATSPNIDALAKEGVLFDRAHTAAPWTCPSVPSLFTSTFLFEHGIVEDAMQLSPGLRTMAERFKDLGYFTTNMFANDFAGPLNGMDRGFDIARKPALNKASRGAGNPMRIFTINGESVEQWLTQDRPADKPFFLYIHNIEPHNPYNATDMHIEQMGGAPADARRTIGALLARYRPILRADWERGKGRALGVTDNTDKQDAILAGLHPRLADHLLLYDAVVREADDRVGEVIAVLKKHNLWDNTVFMVVSDHGEEFAEHGAYLHSQSVYQELAAVPLIVRFPGGQYAGSKVTEIVSLIDVMPTVFSWLGKPDAAAGARGIDLLPLIEGRRRTEPFIITTARQNQKKYYKPWATTRGNINVAIFTTDGHYKGVWNKQMQVGPGQWDDKLESFELFDLHADPTEQNNICEQHRELVAPMLAYVRSWYQQTTQRTQSTIAVELTPDQRENLTQLGYIGGDPEGGADEPIPAGKEPTAGLHGPGRIVQPCPPDKP